MDVRVGKGKEASEILWARFEYLRLAGLIESQRTRELLIWRVPHAVNVPSVPPASERASERAIEHRVISAFEEDERGNDCERGGSISRAARRIAADALLPLSRRTDRVADMRSANWSSSRFLPALLLSMALTLKLPLKRTQLCPATLQWFRTSFTRS